jgi:hypothetical protein
MKRGQVAIFALLGLVLLIIVSFVLMLASTVSITELEQRANEAVRDYLAASPINYYVNLCLEQATREALLEMSSQGGVFWQHQQGPFVLGDEGVTHIPYPINGEVVNVSYGLVRAYDDGEKPQEFYPSVCAAISKNIPDYPMRETYIRDHNLTAYLRFCESHSSNAVGGGFVGQNVFPKICYNSSVNSLTVFIPINTGFSSLRGCTGIEFRSITSEKNMSTEYLLANRILNKTIECVDFSIFEDMDGDNITYLENAPKNVTILYEQESFTANLNLPFRVKLRNQVPVVTSYSFSHNSNVRLGEMQSYIYELLREESINPLFNILRDFDKLIISNTGRNLLLEGMEIEVINFTTTDKFYKWDRILKVTDNKSLISGQNFTYYVAIQNRNPVLDYINPSQHPELNIIVYENDTIVITPFGADPDNTLINYNYSKWGENETSYLRSDCAEELPFTSLDSLKRCMNIESYDGQKFWTGSQLFLNSLQSANFTVNITHIGYHEVRVLIRDQSGLSDFQDVKILVIDLPRINMEIKNFYEQLGENLSIEDPIQFDARTTTGPTIIEGRLGSFRWTLSNTSGPIFSWSTDGLISVLPDPINILNITKEHPMIKGFYNLTLSLTFSPLSSDFPSRPVERTFEFEVNDCLPHRNPSSPAYPYNTTNAFVSDHSCCNTNFEIIQNDICFQETKYGSFNLLKGYADLQATKFKEEIETNLSEYSISPSLGAHTGNSSNNVFKLSFIRNCDGTRGNICGGDVSYTIETQDNCPFNNTLIGQCIGPEDLTVPSSTELSCRLYSAGRIFNQTSGNVESGLCTNIPAPSARNSTGYNNVVGPFMCNGAVCDGSGTCRNTNNPLVSCQCDVSLDAAECDEGFTYKTEGNICFSNCNSNTCQFNSRNQEMPCPEGQSSCFNATHQGGPACYTNVRCTASGLSRDIVRNECGPLGQLTIDGQTVCRFLVESNACKSDGTCNVQQVVKPADNYDCDASSGWIPNINTIIPR